MKSLKSFDLLSAYTWDNNNALFEILPHYFTLLNAAERQMSFASLNNLTIRDLHNKDQKNVPSTMNEDECKLNVNDYLQAISPYNLAVYCNNVTTLTMQSLKTGMNSIVQLITYILSTTHCKMKTMHLEKSLFYDTHNKELFESIINDILKDVWKLTWHNREPKAPMLFAEHLHVKTRTFSLFTSYLSMEQNSCQILISN